MHYNNMYKCIKQKQDTFISHYVIIKQIIYNKTDIDSKYQSLYIYEYTKNVYYFDQSGYYNI